MEDSAVEPIRSSGFWAVMNCLGTVASLPINSITSSTIWIKSLLNDFLTEYSHNGVRRDTYLKYMGNLPDPDGILTDVNLASKTHVSLHALPASSLSYCMFL